MKYKRECRFSSLILGTYVRHYRTGLRSLCLVLSSLGDGIESEPDERTTEAYSDCGVWTSLNDASGEEQMGVPLRYRILRSVWLQWFSSTSISESLCHWTFPVFLVTHSTAESEFLCIILHPPAANLEYNVCQRTQVRDANHYSCRDPQMPRDSFHQRKLFLLLWVLYDQYNNRNEGTLNFLSAWW